VAAQRLLSRLAWSAGLKLAIADGVVKADGAVVCVATSLTVGLAEIGTFSTAPGQADAFGCSEVLRSLSIQRQSSASSRGPVPQSGIGNGS
jgi:hypothetical protein